MAGKVIGGAEIEKGSRSWAKKILPGRLQIASQLIVRAISQNTSDRCYEGMYQKVWEVGLLTCPKCIGEMQIIRFIYQHQVIRKILEHQKIYEKKKQRAPPVRKAPVKEANLVPFDDGWPGYEEPVFEM